MRTRCFVIIDPYINTPEIAAYNLIGRLCGEMIASHRSNIQCVQIFNTCYAEDTLSNFLSELDPIGIICFGSNANITEHRPWVTQFGADLQKYIFANRIPFFGICFAHQLLGHLFGSKVDFLKSKHTVRHSKHHAYRKSRVVHPKLRLMLSKLQPSDLYSENKLDLAFCEAYKVTESWDAKRWAQLMTLPEWKLSAVEARIKQFVTENTFDHFVAHARHEQEVYDVVPGALELAAWSDECGIDALIHPEWPVLSVQPHPETPHDLSQGETLLRNFIYASDISFGSGGRAV